MLPCTMTIPPCLVSLHNWCNLTCLHAMLVKIVALFCSSQQSWWGLNFCSSGKLTISASLSWKLKINLCTGAG